MKKVKVEWLQEGGIQLNGIVALRKKGEEDILDEKAAKGLAVLWACKDRRNTSQYSESRAGFSTQEARKQNRDGERKRCQRFLYRKLKNF